jgi:hypothetical protein
MILYATHLALYKKQFKGQSLEKGNISQNNGHVGCA